MIEEFKAGSRQFHPPREPASGRSPEIILKMTDHFVMAAVPLLIPGIDAKSAALP